MLLSHDVCELELDDLNSKEKVLVEEFDADEEKFIGK